MGTSAKTSLNERFRKEFIDDLPGRFEAMERLVLDLERSATPQESLAELFRTIHSVKGSSSTFGLQLLASICHPLEELVQHASESGASREFVELALSYLDFLRQAIDDVRKGSEDYDKTEKQLTELNKKTFKRRFSIAVAVNSRMLRDICRQAAKSFDARVVEFEDSLNALQRVLTEPFSAIIVSSELYPMRGEALVAAVKLSHRHNQGLKTVLLSSDQAKAGHVNREVDPDYFVLRDQDFIPHLHAVLTDIQQQAPKN